MTTPLDEIVRVAAQLRDCLDEIERLSLAIGGDPKSGEQGAEAHFKRKRLEAHLASTVKNGRKWTADQHNAMADNESFNEWAVWNSLTFELRAVKERAHSYRQILSSLQTAARVEADLAR